MGYWKHCIYCERRYIAKSDANCFRYCSPDCRALNRNRVARLRYDVIRPYRKRALLKRLRGV